MLSWLSGSRGNDKDPEEQAREGVAQLLEELEPRDGAPRSACGNYRLFTDEDFDRFIDLARGKASEWNLCHEGSDGVRVWRRPDPAGEVSFPIIKVHAVLEGIAFEDLIGTLKDSAYRTTWDKRMVEGTILEELSPQESIGYYRASAPNPVAGRDFVTHRCWRMAHRGNEGYWMAVNRSTAHYDVATPPSGTTYCTQADLKGWIPSFVVQMALLKTAPSYVENMQKAAAGYAAWKAQQEEG